MTINRAISALEDAATVTALAGKSPGELRQMDSQILESLLNQKFQGDPQGARDAQAARVAISRALGAAAGEPEYDVGQRGGSVEDTPAGLDEVQARINEIKDIDPVQAERMQASVDQSRQQITDNKVGMAAYETRIQRQAQADFHATGQATKENLEALRDAIPGLEAEGNHVLAAAVRNRYNHESVQLRERERLAHNASGDEGGSDD